MTSLVTLFLFVAVQQTFAETSVVDLPQNDIYNNQVDETIPTEKERKKTLSLTGWQLLNQNNDRRTSKFTSSDGVYVVPGPRGPPGPPGAEITKEEMMKEFKKMIKASAAERARKIILKQCPDCDVESIGEDVLSVFYPGVEDRIRTTNRAPVAFTSRLLYDQKIESRNGLLVKNFQLSGGQFGSVRGVKADLGMDGKFIAKKSGIYQFTTTLNFYSGRKTNIKTFDKNYNFVQVMICPNSVCFPDKSNKNLAIPQYRHSMDSRQRFFTVQMSAQLELKKDDYVTINIYNYCKRLLTVQKDSIVTGIMLSV